MTTFCLVYLPDPVERRFYPDLAGFTWATLYAFRYLVHQNWSTKSQRFFMAGCRRIDLGSMIKRGQEVCYFITYKYIFSLPQCLQRSREYIWVNSLLSTFIFVCCSPKRWVSQNVISKKCWHSWFDFPFSKFSTTLLMSWPRKIPRSWSWRDIVSPLRLFVWLSAMQSPPVKIWWFEVAN